MAILYTNTMLQKGVVILVIIAVAFGFWALRNKPAATNTPEETISQLEDYLNKNTPYHFAQQSDWKSLWWIIPDGWNIYDSKAPTTIANIVVPDKDLESDPELQEALKLNQTISDIFLTKGFTKNNLNSSTSTDDKKFYDYIQAFEKGSTRCTATTDPDISGSATENSLGHHILVACSDRIDQLAKEQLPLLQGINNKEVVVSYIVRQEDFVRFNVNYRRTGHYIIGKFENGVLKPIFSGQDNPMCELMDQNQVPKEIYQNCYEGVAPNLQDRFPRNP